jgi:hypothetical protein
MRRRGKDSQPKTRLAGLRPSPMMVVGSVAASVALLLLTAPALRRVFSDRPGPRISFELGGKPRPGRDEARRSKQVATTIFDGEVYRTEGRLREASAVAIAATLSSVASLSERRPIRDVGELLRDIARRGLLPPGVELVPARNVLVSEHSTIHVRLRAEPFAVEALSLGRKRLDGPALLLRVPDTGRSKNDPPRYFYSLKLEDVRVPDAFAAPSEVLSCGWQADTFRPEVPEGTSEAQLAAWAAEQQSR